MSLEQGQSDETRDPQARIEGLEAKNKELLNEKKNLQAKLATFQAENEQKASDKGPEDQLRRSLDEANKTIKGLEKKLADAEQLAAQKEVEYQKATTYERIKADFIAGVAADVHDPHDAWAVFRRKVASKNGKTVVEYNGEEVDPSALPDMLRRDPRKSYLCRPANRSGGGMGGRSSVEAAGLPSTAGGQNPWLPGGTLMMRATVEANNPALAARLKEEARAYKDSNPGS